MPGWTLQPGDEIERKRLHADFGGSGQGGITPSGRTPNVFVFSDPSEGEQHGYVDRWRDGVFHYTGEGQLGDQRMIRGNAAILNHETDGRALRLFTGARGTVRYEGEFDLDPATPYYETDAPETGDGPVRKVIVFQMRPKDTAARTGRSRLDAAMEGPTTSPVAVEEQWTERAFVAPSQEPYEAERREQKLVLALKAYLEGNGHDVCRLKIVPPGEAKPLFTDLFDRTTNTLIEAKGSVERGSIRMAIGQLADYSRFVDSGPARRAVLLPEHPRQDLVDLLDSQNVLIIWPGQEPGFVDNVGGELL
jgi:hypothetical protein